MLTRHNNKIFNLIKVGGQRTIVTNAVTFDKKKSAHLANDGSGKHVHITKESCSLKDCKSKTCPNLCENPQETHIAGHHTHKPLIGRFARFISSTDANGEEKPQYLVSANKKIEVTLEDKKYLKKNPKHKQHIDNHKEKYEDL